MLTLLSPFFRMNYYIIYLASTTLLCGDPYLAAAKSNKTFNSYFGSAIVVNGLACCVIGLIRYYGKIVPIRINILKLHQVNCCIENITLSKFQGDTRNSFPDIYINSYEKLAICTWVGTKYCILPTLSQRVLYLITL